MVPPHLDITLRPYLRADAPHVVDLINLAASRTLGVRRAVVDAAQAVRLARYVPPTSEKVVAVDAQEIPLGYAYLSSSERSILHEIGGAVHPDLWGQGIGTRLVEWAIQRASVLAARAPAGARVVLQTNLFAAEQQAITLFTSLGFALVREWVHMVIDLDAPPPAPLVPSPLAIRPMDLDEDWDRAGPAMDAAFADIWGAIPPTPETSDADEDGSQDEAPVDDSYSNAPGFCFIVLDGETVAGGVLCNAKLVERADTGRVGSLFVRPEYRRRGIGRALMLAAFQAFWQRAVRRVILDTDTDSFTAAPRFYARLGMRPYRQEWLYEKEVRPGRELRRLKL
jgi:mycothiol synthase